MTDISHRLAAFAAETRFEDLPQAAVEAAKKSLMDTIGVMLGASGVEPAVQPILDLMVETGGREEATVFGAGTRLPASSAAFSNGTLAHGLDYDSQTPWGAHPDSSLVPALLALAERVGGVSGKQLLTSIAIGQELFIRLRCNVRWNMDWNLSSAVGVYSGVAACAALLGLNAKQVANAMGIASLQAGGTMQQIFGTGSDLRGLYAGFIAQTCVNAALLAQKGMLGMGELFEGEAGIFKVYFGGEYDAGKMLDGLGTEFLSGQMTYKYWPAVGNAHTYIHAAIELMRQHEIDLAKIDKVKVYVGTFAERMCFPEEARKKPATMMDAKFSLPMTVAIALSKGKIGVGDFGPDALQDGDILALASKVEAVPDPAFNWNLKLPAGKVEVFTVDGATYSALGENVPGTPENPMTWEQLEDKFRDCAAHARSEIGADAISQTVATIKTLEASGNVSELIKMVA
ncbi:MmgE/PrpD family protein [Donghicola mangrovi]|uniref:MmgE/PrpD family protein n=1 Tax=Donghicola mangrovi TaxID=2729614 RepID=A0A850QI10_9RHOB|nr:MmgE/PrpD family protein [Donghicola mangrovi]NVO25431.1 MmgE/PrpD family protein [Donghicola mangrovi]